MKYTSLNVLLVGSSSFSKMPIISALKCGQWNTHPCLGDTDKRYDPDYTNDITEQNELWGRMNGFYRVTQTSSQKTTRFNPIDLSETDGFPYDDNEAITYVNITTNGSRRYEHRFLFYPPIDQAWCDENPNEFPTQLNALSGLCGINGYATFAENFKVSSHEKDGSLSSLGGSLGFAADDTFEPSAGSAYPTGERSLTFTSKSDREDNGQVITLKSWIFLDEDFQVARAVNQQYNLNSYDLFTSVNLLYIKISEDEFEDGIKNTLEDINTVEIMPFPMTRACLGSECPTEDDWCTKDPNCSPSVYAEPKARVKADVVAGIVVAASIVLIAMIVAFFIIRSKQKEKRLKYMFATRIAEDVKIEGSLDMILTADALKTEFERIDASIDKDGSISREELWTFMTSGKIGTMSESDFDVLFRAIDLDKSGNIDFLEFCNFISICGTEMQHAASHMESTSKEPKEAKISRASTTIAQSNVRKSQRMKLEPEMFEDE